jgi:hypothetical protein
MARETAAIISSEPLPTTICAASTPKRVASAARKAVQAGSA